MTAHVLLEVTRRLSILSEDFLSEDFLSVRPTTTDCSPARRAADGGSDRGRSVPLRRHR